MLKVFNCFLFLNFKNISNVLIFFFFLYQINLYLTQYFSIARDSDYHIISYHFLSHLLDVDTFLRAYGPLLILDSGFYTGKKRSITIFQRACQ